MVIKIVSFLTVLAIIAEYIHGKRTDKISSLAFGAQKEKFWTRFVPLMRVLSILMSSWGLLYLLHMEPRIIQGDVFHDKDRQHVIIVLDVSPSMKIEDAGLETKKSRAKRASEVIHSILDRLSLQQTKFSVIAVYTKALRVVREVKDLSVIYNIIDGLPMIYAFDHGKTDLAKGMKEAFLLAKDWKAQSTMVMLVSDGDTISDIGIPPIPPSIKKVLVIGVGDDKYGKFIHGHVSRQDTGVLRSLARRVKGIYENCNTKNIQTTSLHDFDKVKVIQKNAKWDLRLYAILATILGASILAFIPLALHTFGYNWQKRLQKGFLISKE